MDALTRAIKAEISQLILDITSTTRPMRGTVFNNPPRQKHASIRQRRQEATPVDLQLQHGYVIEWAHLRATMAE
jgi:hypothetical protein